MIQEEMLIWIDRVIIEFSQTTSQEHQVDDQVQFARRIWTPSRNVVSREWQI